MLEQIVVPATVIAWKFVIGCYSIRMATRRGHHVYNVYACCTISCQPSLRPCAQSYRDDTFLGLEAMVTPGISHPIGRLRRGVYSSLRAINVFQPVKVTNDRIWHLASSPGRRQSRSKEYYCLDGRISHCRSSEILEERSHEYTAALQLT